MFEAQVKQVKTRFFTVLEVIRADGKLLHRYHWYNKNKIKKGQKDAWIGLAHYTLTWC